MKKYLHIIITLFLWLGVSHTYGQDKPTLTIEVDKAKFCESGESIFTFRFTGSGYYDFEYEFDLNGDGVWDQRIKSPEGGYNGSSLEIPPLTFTGSGYLKVLYVYDDNFPIGGGESGDLINGESGEVFEGQIGISIDQMPTPTISPDVLTCRQEVTLSANPGDTYTAVEWIKPDGGDFIKTSDTEAEFGADAIGDYNFVYQVTNGVCVNSDELEVTISNQATPSATFSLQEDSICNGETGVLVVTSDMDNRFDLRLNYTDGTDDFSEPITSASFNIALTPSESKTYIMQSLIDSVGCDTPLSESLDLIVNTRPSANAGANDPLCSSEMQLDAILTAGITSTGFWTLVNDNDGSGLEFDDYNDATTLVRLNYNDQLAHEVYDLRWTEVNSEDENCYDTDELQIEFYKEPESEIIMDQNRFYLAKEIDLLAVEPTEGMIGVWETITSPLEKPIVDDPSSYTTSVNNLFVGDYAFKWTVSNGPLCMEVSDEVEITNEGLSQTTGFSPNGDGVNDRFIIGGAKNVSNNTFTVYDMSGKVVFKASNFCHSGSSTSDGWNGQKNDGEITNGTYYYTFEGDNIEPIKSYLILKRSKP